MGECMIHLYTGNGKGKTTAALGLAIRAFGWGKKVLFSQFLKSAETGESIFLSGQEGIDFFRPHMRNRGFIWNMDSRAVEETKEDILNGLNEIKKLIHAGNYSVIVLDEVLDAIECGFLPEEAVLEIINSKDAEYILTGRQASDKLKEKADYITNMVKEKHPYDRGIKARKGIEF